MSGNVSRQTRSQEYPDHLNPFDENYGTEPEPVGRSSKYSTWGASRNHRVVPKKSESKHPWVAAINTPQLGRRLSLLKNTVSRLSFRRPRRKSLSATEPPSPDTGSPTQNNCSFTIISPKIKQRIRQQVFRTPPDVVVTESEDPCTERLKSPSAGLVTPPVSPQPTSPQPPPRARPRKQRPPPPPPPRSLNTTISYSTESPKSEGSPDSHSASDSIRDTPSEAGGGSLALTLNHRD